MKNDDALSLPWLLVATPQLMDPAFKRKVVLVVEHGSTGTMGFILNQKARAPLSELVSVPYVKIPEDAVAWMGGPVDRQSGVILAHRLFHHDTPKPVGMVCHPFRSDSRSIDLWDQGYSTGFSLSSSEDSLVELVHYFQQQLTPHEVKSPTPLNPFELPKNAPLAEAGKFWEQRNPASIIHEVPLAPSASRELYPLRFIVGYSGWAKGQLEDEIRQGAWIQLPGDPKLIFDTPWQHLWSECMSFVGISPPAFAPGAQSFLH